MKAWPEFLRSRSTGKLIWSCHNSQPEDRHPQLLMKEAISPREKKYISSLSAPPGVALVTWEQLT